MMLLYNVKLVCASVRWSSRCVAQSPDLLFDEPYMTSLHAKLTRQLKSATKSHHLRSYLEDLTFPKTGSALVVSCSEAAAFGRLLTFLDFPDTIALSVKGKSPIELFRQKQRGKPARLDYVIADVISAMVTSEEFFPASAAATIASVLQTVLVRVLL